ncbi:MAG: RluA family pseudouridine synthase [Calditrichaeota bacterium]|nr:MAG: RluA family pseudouridine synthase [Calditrichota bacterium]MBL1204405.1 RluA family pseudouridine synthase [Calditrichota bacterium]NOG44234.1 RluA family pseudouridine synthase [Calditrichota bacterium]
MPDKKTIIIGSSGNQQRLDTYLASIFPDKTRSYFTRHIKSGNVLVNNQKVKPGYLLQIDDQVEMDLIEPVTNLEAADIDLDIIFEDKDIIVINKPAGLTVHPGKGTAGDTLVNALLNHTQQLALKGESDRPGIVHRLDKFTSGLLVVAKNDKAHLGLRKQFDTKTIKRTYWSLIWGMPKENSGTVHTFIDRSRKDPTKMAVTKTGREAITHWQLRKDFRYFSLLQLNLETGRTHQIRLHMNWLGCPVVGDSDYNGRDSQLARLPANLRKRGQHLLLMVPNQFLHAKELSFIHPTSNETVVFKSALPSNLQEALNKLPDLFLLED